jgi:hypothetical protein
MMTAGLAAKQNRLTASPKGEPLMRYIPMAALVTVAISWIAFSQSATATVLTFDDLNVLENDTPIPNGYGGLNWSNMYCQKLSLLPFDSGYQHGAVSGTNVAYNGFGNAASVSVGTFTFNGAYLTGAWNDGLNITVTGLLSGNPIYSQTVVVNTVTPTFFNFNYTGIDTLTFNSFGGTDHGYGDANGTQFVMDNFTINTPEPCSLALLSIGAIGLAILSRCRFS